MTDYDPETGRTIAQLEANAMNAWTAPELARARTEQERYFVEQRRTRAVELAVAMFPQSSSPDWQLVIRAARDIAAFLENG